MGSPNLVEPDLTKVDLPHLQRDIVKYTEAGVLPPEAEAWWQQFLDDFVESYGSSPETLPAWYLDDLGTIRQSCTPPVTPAPSIPEKIISLHQNQNNPPKKVSYNVIIFQIFTNTVMRF